MGSRINHTKLRRKEMGRESISADIEKQISDKKYIEDELTGKEDIDIKKKKLVWSDVANKLIWVDR